MNDLRAKILWWAIKRRVRIDQPHIIAVTGSIAKTSTKVAIGAVLKRAYPNEVRVGYGNLNSFLGVPLAILGFEVDFYQQKITWQWLWILKLAVWRGLFGRLPKYLVLEYGADKPGDIEQLAKMLPLDGAVITITSPAHLEFYSSVEQIAEEKGKILSALKPTGWALVNQADPYLPIYRNINRLHNISEKDCPLGLVATETVDISVNFARAVGQKLKIEPQIIEAALATLPRPESRLQLKDLGSDGKIKLLDDSYNASPLSMTAAIGMLAKMPAPRLAVLGDMLELGPDSEKYHRQIGIEARKVADKIIGVGQLAKYYEPDQLFPDSAAATAPIVTQIETYGSIMVKGSHGVKMDRIVAAIIKRYPRRGA